jgi:hypothetical protein
VDIHIQSNPIQQSPKGKSPIGFGFYKIHYQVYLLDPERVDVGVLDH